MEDNGAVVEEKVRACELLERLKDYAEHGSVSHSWACEQLDPWSFPEGDFEVVLFFDLGYFAPDFTVGLRYAIKLGHGCACLLDATFAVGITWRFWEGEDANTKDQGPDEADSHWDAPGSRVGSSFGPKVDRISREDTGGDEELVGADERSTHMSRPGLAGIHGHHNRKSTDSGTCDQPANSNLLPYSISGRLNDYTDDEHDGPDCHGVFPANVVCDGGNGKGTSQGADGQLIDISNE